MGIKHSRQLDVDVSAFTAESISFTASSGEQNSFRAVPKGQAWRLQTMRVQNDNATDAATVAFKLVDEDGIKYATLAEGTAEAGGGEFGWVAESEVWVPSGWTVRTYVDIVTGGSSVFWQYTAAVGYSV